MGDQVVIRPINWGTPVDYSLAEWQALAHGHDSLSVGSPTTSAVSALYYNPNQTGNVTVNIEYVLLSTETNEVLWSYDATVVVDTSGGSGNILASVISTAISTGLTDYVPIAFQVHATASQALPYGKYHPKSGLDGAQKSVNLALKDEALAE